MTFAKYPVVGALPRIDRGISRPDHGRRVMYIGIGTLILIIILVILLA